MHTQKHSEQTDKSNGPDQSSPDAGQGKPSTKEISMKKTVFIGRIIPVEVIESIKPGEKTGIIITDRLNDPVSRWINPDKVKTIELVRARSIDLAKRFDDGEIDWETLEEVF